MSNQIEVLDDELVWRTWLLKNRLRDVQRAAARLRMVKLLSIVVLLSTAALWPAGAGNVLVRFAVSLGALAVAYHAIRNRQYVVAGLFAAMILLFNPVVPVFELSGRWSLMLLLASVIPFAGSLMRLKPVLRPA